MIPDVSDALVDWTYAVQLKAWTKSASDYQTQKVYTDPELFEGMLQPVPAQHLLVKPEGQRLWKWWLLHTLKDLVPGSEVVDPENRRFKVMQKEDWPNVKIYELVEEPVA